MKKIALILQFVLLCAFSGYASAEIVDDISLKTDANGEVDAVIKFSVPIQYLRHFPQRKTSDVAIFFNILGSVPRDEWQNYESHRSPPSDIVRGITVSTRDVTTGPKIEINFIRPAEFTVSAGKSDRTILIHIKPDIAQQKKEDKPAAKPAGATTSLAVPLAVIAAPVIAPALSVTAPKVTSSPATAVVAAQPTAPAKPAPTPAPVATQPAVKPLQAAVVQPVVVPAPPPVAPAPPPVVASVAKPAPPVVVPSPPPEPEPVVAPAPVIPAKPVVIPTGPQPQLGGKDGLPLFPRIDPVVAETGSGKPTDAPSLEVQIKRANNQAGAIMWKGRDAFLAGQMFAAIEDFNNVLNLPPNKYSRDAQIWIGIAREKAGQIAKAKSEYETYTKLYPEGAETAWVKERLAKLNQVMPTPVPTKTTIAAATVKVQATEYQTAQYGSVSTYFYYGNSQTDTVATIAGTQTPTKLTAVDQRSLITNVSMTARAYNNEYDNRVVFQDFKSVSFIQNQNGINRLNAAYYDVKSRLDNYSARIGRQSALGGGVMGRFDGVAAGYGFLPDWRANVSTGVLSDTTLESKPKFISLGVDFGVNSPLGGSAYFINQKVDGITGRRAVGGNMRYFEQGKTAMAMLDYDTQFKALNLVTVQGTLNYDSGTDYNFLLDRRRSPVLDIRNAINGTTVTINSLLLNGFDNKQLIDLANSRTSTSNVALIGVTQRVKEKYQVGTDLIVSNTSALQASGGIVDPAQGCTATEGCVNATPASGNAWTLNGRLSASDVFSRRDISMFSMSISKSNFSTGKTLLFFNHAYPGDIWTMDNTVRLFWQTDNTGGKTATVAPVFKAGYRARTTLTLEGEVGIDFTNSTPAASASSNTTRKYFSLGFRWDL